LKFITRYGTESKVYDVKPILDSFEYLQWKNNGKAADLLLKISNGFKSTFDPAFQRDSDVKFDLRGTSGAMVFHSLPDNVELEDIFFLQILVLEKLRELGYILNLAEIKTHNEFQISHILYLKPSVKLPRRDGKVDQLFGNVHIEIKTDDEELTFFKIIVHRYNDSNYHEGNAFTSFVEYVFGGHGPNKNAFHILMNKFYICFVACLCQHKFFLYL